MAAAKTKKGPKSKKLSQEIAQLQEDVEAESMQVEEGKCNEYNQITSDGLSKQKEETIEETTDKTEDDSDKTAKPLNEKAMEVDNKAETTAPSEKEQKAIEEEQTKTLDLTKDNEKPVDEADGSEEENGNQDTDEDEADAISEKNIIKGKRAVVKPKTYLDSSSEPHHPDKQIKPKTKKKAAKGDESSGEEFGLGGTSSPAVEQGSAKKKTKSKVSPKVIREKKPTKKVTSTSTIPSKNKSPIAKAKSPIAKAKVIADDPVTEEETIDDGIVVAGQSAPEGHVGSAELEKKVASKKIPQKPKLATIKGKPKSKVAVAKKPKGKAAAK